MRKTERIQLRVTEETKRKLRELAEAEHRGINNYIEHIVEKEHEKLRKEREK